MPAVFLRIALTPVEVLGCRTRGLLALTVALLSGISAIYTAIVAKKRAKDESDVIWWVISTLILTIPVVALIILA